MNARRGFTLLELMVVSVVVGVLAAIGFVQLDRIRERLAVRTAAALFVSTHNRARTVAIRFGRVSYLRIDTLAARFWVEADTTLAATGTLSRIGPTQDVSSSLSSLSSTRSLLCFDARGIASQKGSCPPGDAVLVFTGGGTVDTIRTTALGKVLER